MSQGNDKRKEIAKAKFIVGTSIQDIADELDVSRRTIERWAAEGDWRDLRQQTQPLKRPLAEASNIISFQPKLNPERSRGAKNPKPEFRPPRQLEEMDDIGVIEAALSELHASLPEALAGESKA